MNTSTSNCSENVKCGSIYLTKEDTLLLICEFCGDYYYTLELLSLHVKDHLCKAPTKIKRENSISYSIECIPPEIEEDHKLQASVDSPFLLGIKREDSISFDSDNESFWKDNNVTVNDNAVFEYPAKECHLSGDNYATSPNHLSSDTSKNCIKRNKRTNCCCNVNEVKTSVAEIPHTTKRNYIHKCSFCDLCFEQNRKLIDHENTHTGRQPYQCKFCPRTFAAASSLWSHNKLHTQERRHKCFGCERTFAHKHMRDRHNREHHLPDTDPQRYFECTKCDCKFKTHRQMCYHRAIHKNKTETFTCDHCQRQCKSRSVLVDHMQKVHEGRKEIRKQNTGKSKTV